MDWTVRNQIVSLLLKKERLLCESAAAVEWKRPNPADVERFCAGFRAIAAWCIHNRPLRAAAWIANGPAMIAIHQRTHGRRCYQKPVQTQMAHSSEYKRSPI